jgi:hypothetical protein
VGWTAALWLVLTAVLCTEERPLPLRRRWLPGVVVVADVAGHWPHQLSAGTPWVPTGWITGRKGLLLPLRR